MKQHGTAWAESGEGATVDELLSAVETCSSKLRHRASGPALKHWGDYSGSERTNLRLTGAPMLIKDLERIAACEVTV